ncbi:MAG: YbhB/YbcL family Raf kinase inhibitor-like protein [bacterium]|nr:YbhB/YbcL family Raf kinase inhibitor-like protein [bacterium]
MKIESSAFKHNTLIPQKYTCDGENINPALMFLNIPKGTKSLALIMDDPDAPVGLWVHWVLWNISPDTKEIEENYTPKDAIEGMTSFGKEGYGGPCPPNGEHRYFFKLYALDSELVLPTTADKETLEEAMVGRVLEKAELIGLYSRG